MRKRLFGFAMSAAILAAACGSSATPGTSKAPTTSGPTGAPTTAATQVPLPDLTKTNYKPEPVGKRGGKLVLGISGEPTTIWWNIYDSFANNVDVFSGALWSLGHHRRPQVLSAADHPGPHHGQQGRTITGTRWTSRSS